ncbi:RxLR effector protein [Phytophthora ramorum]|uniref:RxLR effector protein n=1 Tax=Phytophthora ramorum TaxID=164328 RepID=UPI00309A6307|nr:RxLR effector protein [Phytophthora ramorum]
MHRCLLITLTISSVFLSLDASAAAQHSEPSLAIVSSSHRLVVPDKIDIVSAVRFLRAGHTAPDEGEERAGLSVSMAEKAKTLLSSSTISTEKLQKWLSSGKNADTVFSRMQLTKAGDDLLSNPQFSVWIKYVDDLSAKYPAKATSAITTLTTQYGDDALYKLLESAKKLPRTENLATRLQAEQMQHWATVGKSPDDVFRLFGLRRAGSSLLTYPKFTSWTTYVDNVNALNPEKATSMIPTLTAYYGETLLFKMLDADKKSDVTKSIATKLEAQQLQGWLKSGNTPDSAFVHMGLGDVGDNVLASPLFSTWVKYLDDFNAQYSAKETTLFHVLTKRFEDEPLAKIIAFGKTLDSTKAVAAKLETQQRQVWLTSGKSSDDVFTLLKLDKAPDNFFDNPLYKTWGSYMNVYNNKHPGKQTNLFKTLTTKCKDKPLIKILEEAKKFPNLESTASKLQTEKIQSYLASKKSPDEVFTLLGLGDAWDNVIGNPLFKTWLTYVKTFDQGNPAKKTDWYLALHGAYGDGGVESMVNKGLQNPSTVKIAEKVQAGLLKRWLIKEKSPDLTFNWILRHPTADEKVFADPRFETWAKYLSDFNQQYPDKKTTMIDAFRASYNDRALLRMFDAAKKVPGSEKLVTNLENALLDKWVSAKETPAVLSRRFSGVVAADEMIQRYIKKADAAGNIA